LGSYGTLKRAEKGRLINIVCVLCVKPVERRLWPSTITKGAGPFIDLNVIPAQGMHSLKNQDGYRWDIRKRITVRSAVTKANIRNNLTCSTWMAISTIVVLLI
jgi:hypothetical protein